jgi:hypothetical protein
VKSRFHRFLKKKLNIDLGKTHSNFDVQNLIKTDLKIYLNTSIPKDYPGFIQCHIKREKQGLSKGFSTTFSLYFDGGNENEQVIIDSQPFEIFSFKRFLFYLHENI